MSEQHEDSASGLSAFEDSLDYVTVTVGGQLLGLPIGRVQDVFIATRITPVPLAPYEIVGLINLRGRVVTAICMRRRMRHADTGRLPTGTDEHELTAVGLDQGGEAFALAARLRAEPRHAGLRIIGLTSLPTPETHVAAIQAQFDEVVAKFDRRALIAELAETGPRLRRAA